MWDKYDDYKVIICGIPNEYVGIWNTDNRESRMKYNTGDIFVSKHSKTILLVLKSKGNIVWIERHDIKSDRIIQPAYTLVEIENYCDNDIWKHYPVVKWHTNITLEIL